jgi:hypothetical protein
MPVTCSMHLLYYCFYFIMLCVFVVLFTYPPLLFLFSFRVLVFRVVWWTFKRLYCACFVFKLFGDSLSGGGRVGGCRGGMYYCFV